MPAGHLLCHDCYQAAPSHLRVYASTAALRPYGEGAALVHATFLNAALDRRGHLPEVEPF